MEWHYNKDLRLCSVEHITLSISSIRGLKVTRCGEESFLTCMKMSTKWWDCRENCQRMRSSKAGNKDSFSLKLFFNTTIQAVVSERSTRHFSSTININSMSYHSFLTIITAAKRLSLWTMQPCMFLASEYKNCCKLNLLTLYYSWLFGLF